MHVCVHVCSVYSYECVMWVHVYMPNCQMYVCVHVCPGPGAVSWDGPGLCSEARRALAPWPLGGGASLDTWMMSDCQAELPQGGPDTALISSVPIWGWSNSQGLTQVPAGDSGSGIPGCGALRGDSLSVCGRWLAVPTLGNLHSEPLLPTAQFFSSRPSLLTVPHC